MKLFTKTFGCQMNVADSDEMTRHLFRRGFIRTDAEGDADAVLVNTCTVREMAEHKAVSYMGRLRDWKAENPDRLIFVTGCAAERAKTELKRRFPYVDLIVGAKDIDQFPEEADQLLSLRGIDEEDLPVQAPSAGMGTGPAVQFVTVMRGCNYSCTYCIVPAVRGRERYLPAGQILDDVKTRVESGAKEIWLLGQTVNSYRPVDAPSAGYDFSDLLRDVAAIDGVKRVRFMSPHPFYLTQRLVRAMAETPEAGTHLHLPVQSGSNAVLKRMRRTYTRESFISATQALRDAVPDLTLTTDLIVGFPGETDADFEQTITLMDEATIDSAYCFKYSPRPGTDAARLVDDVSTDVKEERLNRLLALVDDRGNARARGFVGTTRSVLFDERLSDGSLRGRDLGNWRVRLSEPRDIRPGDIVNVGIESHHSRELKGVLAPSSTLTLAH